MGAQLRVYRRRIKSVQSTKKITKAMELIASARIVKAQQRVEATGPYFRELMAAITAALSSGAANVDRLRVNRDATRAGVILLSADRGLAGAFSSNIIRDGEALNGLLESEGKEPVHYICGRKAAAFYRFRNRPVKGEWSGFSDQPSYEDAVAVAEMVLADFAKGGKDGGIDEIHLVYTHFINMAQQEVRVRRLMPVEIVEEMSERQGGTAIAPPLYQFEPSPEAVLEALIPKFLTQAIYFAMLMSAASEHAARRRAMKSATDNAEELIKSLTRQANQARQAEITQEISEIVGGADALASASSGR